MTRQEAQQLRHLIKKYKGFLKEKQSLTPFKEPVAFLMRETGRIDFYEQVVGEKFRFTHSGGEERYINIEKTKIFFFPYAGDSIRCYMLHENEPFPLPASPEETAELFRIQNEKALHDVRKYHAEELKATALNTKNLLLGIAAVAAVIAVYLIARPAPQVQPIIQAPVIPQTPQQAQILGSMISIGVISIWNKIKR